MLRRTYLLVIAISLLLAGAAIVGCQAIAGLRSLEYQPSRTTCSQVVLPSMGNGRIRLVNAGTHGATVDFCLRASGSSDWGSPVFHVDGDPVTCPALPYADATVPFAVAAGNIDVKAITAGSACTAPALSEQDGITVGDSTQGGAVMTIVRMGASAEQIVSHAEEPMVSGSVARVRFINAVAGNQPFIVGLTTGSTLPQMLLTSRSLMQPIAPGGVPVADPQGPFGAIDSIGYASIVPGISLGGAFVGQTNAFFAVTTDLDGSTISVFALGDPADTSHPPRALTCKDITTVVAAPDAGAASYSATCTLSSLPSLYVDTLNTGLYGAASPFESQRRPWLYNAIAARTSDLMCLVETSRDADKAGIAAAAKAQFPYSFYPTTNLDAMPTDPTTLDGAVPPPPSGSACGNIDLTAALSCPLPCVTNDAGGPVETTACLPSHCAAPLAPLLYGTPPVGGGTNPQQCFDCLIYYYTSSPIYLAQACATDTRQQFSFQGMTTNMILSHYPLNKTDAYILPGTGYRHALLYAEVQLQDQAVDFYCVQLISPLISSSLPYWGNYGDRMVDGSVVPSDPVTGWEGEQDLQVQRAIAFIKRNSLKTGHAAIIAGDWHATLPTGDAGLAPQSTEVVTALDSAYGGAFTRAEPPGYQPTCVYCPQPANPYNTGPLPEDFTPTYLYNYPPNATISDTLWGTEPVVPIVPGPNQPWASDAGGPISEYYGRQVVVVRPH
jgi:hypothetical protein